MILNGFAIVPEEWDAVHELNRDCKVACGDLTFYLYRKAGEPSLGIGYAGPNQDRFEAFAESLASISGRFRKDDPGIRVALSGAWEVNNKTATLVFDGSSAQLVLRNEQLLAHLTAKLPAQDPRDENKIRDMRRKLPVFIKHYCVRHSSIIEPASILTGAMEGFCIKLV